MLREVKKTTNIANQPLGNCTLKGNAGEFTFLNMYVIWVKGKWLSVCKTGNFLSHGVSILKLHCSFEQETLSSPSPWGEVASRT